MHLNRLAPLVLAVLSALSAPAPAQTLPSPESLLAGASEQGALMDKYREILRNPDADIRHSAFIQLAVVEDPLIRQMAYDEAFSASDATLRALALRYSLFDRESIIVQYPGSELPPDAYRLVERNYSTGEFVARSGNTRPGRVQGLQVMIEYNRCMLELALNDDDMLVGEQICAEQRIPIQVDLRGM